MYEIDVSTIVVDPEDCGCTDCIVGEAVHARALRSSQVLGLIHGRITLFNRTSGKLIFAHSDYLGGHNIQLVDPWTNSRSGSWIVEDTDLLRPPWYLAWVFDEDGLIIG